MRRIIGGLIKANEIFNLIENHDRIMVGVSGGKDSSLLLLVLNLYAKKLKETKGWDVKVFAANVKVDFYDTNYEPYLKWVKDNNLELEVIQSNVADVLNAKKKNNRVICSLCAKMKKAILIRHAKSLKCNKIAMAHHFDDAIETLFLNMLYEGRMATFSPINYLDREKITLIRPFVLTNEKDIIAVTKKLNIPIIVNACPNEHTTQRAYIKEFINKNFYDNKSYPNAYLNFRSAFLNGENANLWFTDKKTNKDLLKLLKVHKVKE